MKRVRSVGGRRLLVGVAALMLVSVGDVPRVLAAGPDSSTFVPITPCRFMDTRATSPVGPRNTPIGPDETYAPLVWGTNGNCTIPSTATAVSLNVTFVGPTSSGFVTVFPPDQPVPNTSNLNFVAGQAPAPNAVTSPLSADGRIGFWNEAGTVNLIADIVGYYGPAGSPDADLVLGACSGLLRWDLNTCKPTSYPTGDNPVGVAFDGSSLWIANGSSDTVSKINPATGTKVDYPTGDGPLGVAFDGSSIWVTNAFANTVSKINPATGTKTDFATGDNPNGVAFDGTSIWVANQGSDNVSKINPATGTKTDFATGDLPYWVAFDGTSIWVTNIGDNTVSKINPATGTKVDVATGNSPHGVAFDGTSIWVANAAGSTVSKINPVAESLVFTTPTGNGASAVVFDGTSIWVTNFADNTVSKVNPVDYTKTDYPTGTTPYGMAFDGSNIWVANTDSDTVSKFVAGRGVLESDPVGSTDSSVFVPVTPCRLMDTRAASQIGPRGTPIGPDETYAPLVWGSNGNCVVPSTATAVSMNVTFVGPTSDGFVTVFPPDQQLPNTSNLNFALGQAPKPNAVTSPLSADGRIGFWNERGTVNLIADVVGYYEVAGSAPGGLVMGHCGALLRWDLPGCRAASFPTGDNAYGVVFDGTSIWVTNDSDNTVSKINPTTGSRVDYATGDTPTGIAFDGTNIWVANNEDDTVSKIDPATGARIDYDTGLNPIAVVFDGRSVWISNQGDNTVSKMNPADGTKTDHAVLDTPWGIAFDGGYIWVANYNDHSVSKIDPATGLALIDYPTGFNPTGVVFDGSSIWITNATGPSVTKMNPATGATTEYTTGIGPSGIAFDGTNLWIANNGGDTISKMNPSDGTRVDYAGYDDPMGVAFDGGNIWIANHDSDTVSKVVASGSGLRLSGVASEGSSSFVPVTPCRLMDTRPGSTVGPRNTPIGAGETYSPLVWGTNGQCTIPSTATAVSLNVTFVGPTSSGFVTVFPPDQPVPNTSNLNFVAGQAPAPNAVTSPLSFDGKIGFWSEAGTVNLIADIVGYYEPVEPITTRCLPTLRWDLRACEASSIATGDEPRGIAFDGTHLWVANSVLGTVSKIDPLTGSTVEYPTGGTAYAVAFDGTFIWVTNADDDTVSKIRPETGVEIAEYDTQVTPRGIAFDGTSIWVANLSSDSVSKMNPFDGTRVDIPVGDAPWGVAFDGRHIWVTNRLDDTVSEVDPVTELEVNNYPVGDEPHGIAFDGTNLWITNFGNGSDSVMRMNPADGTTDEYFVADSPTYLAFDGISMWVVSSLTQSVIRIDVTTGAATHFYVNINPDFIAFDGESLWITRYSDDVVERVII